MAVAGGQPLQDEAEDVQRKDKEEEEEVQLKRSLGVFDGVSIIVGVVVGSGIFVSPLGVLKSTGSPGAALIVWALCGLLALLGALCFAELGTSIKTSGGEYTYVRLAYGKLASFLYIWVLVLVIIPCSNAIAALTFATYVLQPLFRTIDATVSGVCSAAPPEQAVSLLALAILMLLVYINCVSIEGSIKLQGTFTSAKVLALVSIISYGAYYLLAGNQVRSLDNSSAANGTTATEASGWFSGTATSLPQLARAFYSGFFTYSGWTALNCVTEEIKRPERNMPRAIVASITGVTLIYILANLSYFAVLTRTQILNSDAIAVAFGEAALGVGPAKWIMPLAVAASAIGGLNASVFATSRVYLAAAREGQLFGTLSMISANRLTPLPALIFLGATSAVYLSTTRVLLLIEYMTFVEATFATMAVSTLLALRVKFPHLHRPLRVPLLVPLAYLAFSSLVVLLPLWTAPVEALAGTCIMLSGVPGYYLTAGWRAKPRLYQKAIDRMNIVAQKLTLSVRPTVNVEDEAPTANDERHSD